jgi:hypothetical protein
MLVTMIVRVKSGIHDVLLLLERSLRQREIPDNDTDVGAGVTFQFCCPNFFPKLKMSSVTSLVEFCLSSERCLQPVFLRICVLQEKSENVHPHVTVEDDDEEVRELLLKLCICQLQQILKEQIQSLLGCR